MLRTLTQGWYLCCYKNIEILDLEILMYILIFIGDSPNEQSKTGILMKLMEKL